MVTLPDTVYFCAMPAPGIDHVRLVPQPSVAPYRISKLPHAFGCFQHTTMTYDTRLPGVDMTLLLRRPCWKVVGAAKRLAFFLCPFGGVVGYCDRPGSPVIDPTRPISAVGDDMIIKTTTVQAQVEFAGVEREDVFLLMWWRDVLKALTVHNTVGARSAVTVQHLHLGEMALFPAAFEAEYCRWWKKARDPAGSMGRMVHLNRIRNIDVTATAATTTTATAATTTTATAATTTTATAATTTTATAATTTTTAATTVDKDCPVAVAVSSSAPVRASQWLDLFGVEESDSDSVDDEENNKSLARASRDPCDTETDDDAHSSTNTTKRRRVESKQVQTACAGR